MDGVLNLYLQNWMRSRRSMQVQISLHCDVQSVCTARIPVKVPLQWCCAGWSDVTGRAVEIGRA